MSPIDHWPLFGLRVSTPRLELRYPTDDDLAELAERSAVEGIHDPAVTPFAIEWTDVDPPEQQRNTMQFHWHIRASWKPTDWNCNLVAVGDGRIIGTQSASATQFAILRSAMTGSYLLRAYQGQGLGKEMRAAILHLLFDGLGAEIAETGAFTDNAASIGVTRSLGYELQGHRRVVSRGVAREQVLYRLSREEWTPRRRDDIEVLGLEPCLAMFGIGD